MELKFACTGMILNSTTLLIVINIILTDNSEYTADISSFQKVYCYPNEDEWPQAFTGDFKADIEWPGGFGIHLDQIAGLAIKQNMIA